MRALFMDFPNDTKAATLNDEYMLGPDFLVAPVTDQGVTSREVYLPAGTDWYNYWTNEKLHGGQTVTVNAPIDTLPLFVKAGSILPLGVPVLSTNDPQALEKLRIYPGADASFTLYQDDGKTYNYEKGDSKITHLRWNDAAGKLTHDGATAWTGPDDALLEVVGRR
jgi:alpha-glucosidase (family GH31 glycosyl hydrolase)